MAHGEAVNYAQLEEFLRALSHRTRLELLHTLRMPHELNDLRAAPGPNRAGVSPERPISRQAIQEHLEKLVEIGAVVEQPAEGGGRRGSTYVVNPLRVFQIAEEVRAIMTVTVGGPVAATATVEAATRPAPVKIRGPKFVLIRGYLEGKMFPLTKDVMDGDGAWVIGRRPDLAVSLEYDPYVSLLNSEVFQDGEDFRLADRATSRNGTWLNWEPVEDAPTLLRHGDVVGVGRSLMVFRSA